MLNSAEAEDVAPSKRYQGLRPSDEPVWISRRCCGR